MKRNVVFPLYALITLGSILYVYRGSISIKNAAAEIKPEVKVDRNRSKNIRQKCLEVVDRKDYGECVKRMKLVNVPKKYIIKSSQLKTSPRQTVSKLDPRAVVPDQTFDVTVINAPNVNGKPTQFILYDFSIDESGGTIDITLNGRYVKTVTLTVGGAVISLPALKPGTNNLGFNGRVPPPTGPIIAGVRFDRTDILPEEPYFKGIVVRGGEKKVVKLGFPQVQYSQYDFPESAQHVREVWSKPPSPMEEPIPGKPETPLRRGPYPRLLTVDRDRRDEIPPYLGATKRRNQSVKNYRCKSGDDRDEYPPAVFLENGGQAHIKCIRLNDNRGSGAAFGAFLREKEYQARPDATKVTIPNGAVVEFYLTP
jgi:hypothetical protein